jgi:hypothetical protein
MSARRDPDQQFHENLKTIGSRADVPAGPSPDVRSRCVAALESAGQGSHWSVLEMMKKPSVLSAFGMAAAIAIAFSLLFPAASGPQVQAATIIKKLNEQIEQSQLIEVTLDSLGVDNVFVNGQLQVSDQGVAGEIEAIVYDRSRKPEVEVDLNIGISSHGGWILIRKLTVPDPQAQAILGVLFPSGAETLLLLPEDAVKSGFGADIKGGLSELHSGELVVALKKMIESHDELGATVENQPDGTVLLTLPIHDAEALAALEQWANKVESSGGETREVEVEDKPVGVDEDDELIGSTLRVVYDPVAEIVRSFHIDDLGTPGSNISVTIGEGEIDPALLDHSNFTTPKTRTLDLGSLESMFEQFDVDLDL